ncbi:MAG TPA: helix-turn-helix domain-containing protein [Caulobacteraceae bacterium]|jgi:AcrR family transcriptional regulator|nr:helix-turn-helix domain-containing protein [Caulobacteraceae bacterium]
MVRGSKFDQAEFVDAALALLCEGGPSAVTMAAIARRSGAPTGSIYHRFPSRSAVVAAAWLNALTAFADHVEAALAGSPAAAAASLIAWARARPREAKALFLNEPASLFDSAPPDDLSAAIRIQEARIERAFEARLGAEADRAEAFARLRFATIDGPAALIRPYLQSGEAIPVFVDGLAADLRRLTDDRASVSARAAE